MGTRPMRSTFSGRATASKRSAHCWEALARAAAEVVPAEAAAAAWGRGTAQLRAQQRAAEATWFQMACGGG